MKTTLLTFLMLLQVIFYTKQATAQDLHFSQFFETPLLRNPSLAGIYKGDVRVQAVYRDQWNSIANAYRTGSLNAEFKRSVGGADDFLTLGLQVLYDRAGTIGWTSTHLLPVMNYHKSLSSERNQYLSVGFMGGLVQRKFDRSAITTNSQYDGMGDGETFDRTSYLYADGSAGISYNSDIAGNANNNFYIGVGYHHFNRAGNSFYKNANIRMSPKLVFSGGVRFDVSENSYVTFQADYSKQAAFEEKVAGGMVSLKIGPDHDTPDYTLHAGTYLRWNDAVIPVVKIDYAPFSVAISYDVNISQLKSSSRGRGGFELSLSYIGFLKKLSRSSLNSTLCPRF